MADFLSLRLGHFAGDDQPLGHILQRRFVGKQVVILEHKPRATAQGVDLGMAGPVQVQAGLVKLHGAGIGPFQKVQAPQQSRFPLPLEPRMATT